MKTESRVLLREFSQRLQEIKMGSIRLMPDFIYPLGTQTSVGEIQMIGSLQGERYYWMVDEDGMVSMIPHEMMDQYVSGIV